MKSGAFNVPPNEAVAAQVEQTAQAERRAAQAVEIQKRDALYQTLLAKARAAPAVTPIVHPIAAALKGDLVGWKNGGISHFDDEGLPRKKFIALYFSAHWCAPAGNSLPNSSNGTIASLRNIPNSRLCL